MQVQCPGLAIMSTATLGPWFQPWAVSKLFNSTCCESLFGKRAQSLRGLLGTWKCIRQTKLRTFLVGTVAKSSSAWFVVFPPSFVSSRMHANEHCQSRVGQMNLRNHRTPGSEMKPKNSGRESIFQEWPLQRRPYTEPTGLQGVFPFLWGSTCYKL